MQIVFISNYYNHHQKFLSNELEKRCNLFKFISTSKMREERKKLGYGEEEIPQYVIEYSNEKEAEIYKLIEKSSVVIWGAAPSKMVNRKVRRNDIVFKYTERPFKNKDVWWKYVPRFVVWHRQNPINKRIYMLCASAFASGDYSKYFLFKNKSFKWGYFPETKKYDIQQLLKNKSKTRILWCGRFLDWKHPDELLEVARLLKREDYKFEICFIGTGELEEQLKEKVLEYQLEESVSFVGAMPPAQVRKYMEEAGMYVFTSDRREGWGVVLNEAMNSGCAVIASHLIGSVPYLINNNENGLVYKSGEIQQLYEKIKYLLEYPEEQERLGSSAYKTISEVWNAEVAAERFIRLSEGIMQGKKVSDMYINGPCSKAEIIKEDWLNE